MVIFAVICYVNYSAQNEGTMLVSL